DRDPDLSLQSILGSTVERLDSQMLFDPFEEEFDLPSAAIELRDNRGRKREVVGQEDKPIVVDRIVETNATQFGRIPFAGIEAAQSDDLIAEHAGGFVDRQ